MENWHCKRIYGFVKRGKWQDYGNDKDLTGGVCLSNLIGFAG